MPISVATAAASTNATTAASVSVNVDGTSQVVVGIVMAGQSPTDARSLTINASAATMLVSATGAFPRAQIGYWHPGSTGAIAVASTSPNSANLAIAALVLNGVATAAPFGGTAVSASNANSSTPSLAVGSSAGDLSLAALCYQSTAGSSISALTTGGGVTEYVADLSASGFGNNHVWMQFGTVPSSGTASTLAWIGVGNAKPWAMAAITINAAAAAAAARGHNITSWF